MIKVGDIVSTNQAMTGPVDMVIGTVTRVQGYRVYSLWEFTDSPEYPKAEETYLHSWILKVVENPKNIKDYEDALI